MNTITVVFYKTKTGKQPYAEWESQLDKQTQTIVLNRLARVRLANFGDCKPIRGARGVYELRVDYGPGYRIYYAKKRETIVILLVGGDKKSQGRDIEKAKQYWLDYKESKND
ncbi:type II toxin-antitoxin system RelE/ParE family toxin [Candidatus Babeliales bacterium]|nr:type II toxin-antitoxin system RelE/ParE family toxin [Candidatus Babeliales bacterium]